MKYKNLDEFMSSENISGLSCLSHNEQLNIEGGFWSYVIPAAVALIGIGVTLGYNLGKDAAMRDNAVCRG